MLGFPKGAAKWMARTITLDCFAVVTRPLKTKLEGHMMEGSYLKNLTNPKNPNPWINK